MVHERRTNPYRPGFNQAPVVFAGREDVLDGAAEALEVAAFDGRTPRPLILLGPRGLGKTVTLGEISSLAAERHSWPSVHVEARTGGDLMGDLALRLREAALLLSGQAPSTSKKRSRVSGGKVEARAFGLGGAVEMRTEPLPDGPSGQVAADALRQAMTAATAAGAGLVVTLDELHSSSPSEVHHLGAMLQESVPEGWPLVVALAALPSLRSNRGARRVPTYLERAEWHELEGLPVPDAREALTGPARAAGRPLTDEAATVLLDRAGGYPYAIQVAGHFAWRASHGVPRIEVEHAREAVPRIEKDLAQLFRGRWDDASAKEQEYLRAVASFEGQAPHGGLVAARLGRPVSAVSYLRARLMKKGTLYRDAAGGMHFITPGMASWVRDLEQ